MTGEKMGAHGQLRRCRPERAALHRLRYQPKSLLVATTKARVKAAMTTSPMAPTAKGRRPCLRISRKLVRRPTPANVRRKAQRERLASEVIWSLSKKL